MLNNYKYYLNSNLNITKSVHWCIVRKISIPKTMNIFLSVYIKKRRRSGATLRIFDVCNQEKIQVVWYSYLRNDALATYSLLKLLRAYIKDLFEFAYKVIDIRVPYSLGYLFVTHITA